jgi:hypothetical protein
MSLTYYYCYSPPLFQFLRENGEKYICAGLNENTHKKFWQYARTPELDRLLDVWQAQKPTR